MNYWPLITLDDSAEARATHYGGNVYAMTPSPYNYFGEKDNENVDFKRMARGKRWILWL